MSKFLILFIGGNIPEGKKQQSITDRLAWMDDLKSEGKFVDGSPLLPEGKVIHQDSEADYEHSDSSINGYVTIEAEDIAAAAKAVESSPQVKPEYGSAVAEI